MNVLLIEQAGLVVDCISADNVDRASEFFPDYVCIEQTGSEGPGWKYAHGVFTAPVPVDPSPVVTTPVSPRQIRQAMTAFGMRAAVEAFVSAADQDTKDWWEFASSFERQHPMIVGAANALGQTSDHIDALFNLAGSL